MLINLIEDDGTAESLGDLLALSIVSFLKIHTECQHLASVRDRNRYVLVHIPLLLENHLDERIDLLGEGVHPALVNRLHLLAESVGELVALGVGIELLVESEVDGQLGHHIFLEILIRHSLRAACDDRGGVDHHIPDIDLDPLTRKGVAPSGIDGLALVVHHVVILKESLTDSEVVLLDFLLGVLD